MSTLQLEMISCGNCKRCLAGSRVHGPFWYSYRSVPAKNERGQKTISEYIGSYKSGGEDTIDPSPEMEDQVKKMRQMSAKVSDLLVSFMTPDEVAAADTVIHADIQSRLKMRAAKKADTAAQRVQHQVEAKRIKSEVKDTKTFLKARREADGRVQPSKFKAIEDMLPKLQRQVKDAKKESRTGS